MVAIAGMRLGLFTDDFARSTKSRPSNSARFYIPQVMKDILSDSKLKSDPIHPNGAGYRLMAERIAEKIMPLLREADRLTGRRGS